MTEIQVTEILEKIKKKFPELAPVVDRHGDKLINMAFHEIDELINLVVARHSEVAYRTLLGKLNIDELLDEGDELIDKWDEANRDNAEKITLQQNALADVLNVALNIAFAKAGLI